MNLRHPIHCSGSLDGHVRTHFGGVGAEGSDSAGAEQLQVVGSAQLNDVVETCDVDLGREGGRVWEGREGGRDEGQRE